jgi:hypothetical protein
MRNIFLCFLFLSSVLSGHTQMLTINSLMSDRERFVKEVKQLDQFFKRFNNEEDIFTGQQKSMSQLTQEKKNILEFQTERKKSLITLLNFEDSTLIKNRSVVDFINYAGDDSNHIEIGYYDQNWFAKVNCSVKYKDKTQNIFLTMIKQGTNAEGYKWVIVGVKAPFISLDPVRTDTLKFISPMNHEVGFIDLFKVFKDYPNITQYASRDFAADELSVFFSLVKAKEIQYVRVNSIQYHFLQLKNWIFTVDYFNRASNNSGWLVSSVYSGTDAEKKDY